VKLDVSKAILRWEVRIGLRELAVDVDGVQAGDEVDKDIVHALRYLLQQGRGDLFVGWIVGEVNRDEELLSFSVDITDVDTAFMSEEDPVALLVERSVEVKATMEIKT
jgi:hypothetical protein